jgi:hypothetical protein
MHPCIDDLSSRVFRGRRLTPARVREDDQGMVAASAVRVRSGRTALVAWSIAVAAGTALLAAAFLAPVYGTDSSSGEPGDRTLVAVNGPGVLVVAGLPLVLALAVGAALRWRRPTLAWALTALLGALNLVALLSVGVFILPVTTALLVACTHPPTVPPPTEPPLG